MKTSLFVVTFFTVLLFTACGSADKSNETSSKTNKSNIPAFPKLPGVEAPPNNEY